MTKDPNLTPAIAAIESLIALLSSNPLTTMSETDALISAQSSILLSSQRNPLPVAAGTGLFQRHLISSFHQRSFAQQSDFAALRKQLINNSRLFVSRAQSAPKKIFQHTLPFIRDDSTIFTYGTSPVIANVLNQAVNSDRYFSLISITSPTTPTVQLSANMSSIPTTNLPLHALTYALSSLTPQQRQPTSIFIPATAVLENGSIMSALGTHQLALLAHAFTISLYVVAESYKFVRAFPLGTGATELARMGVKQDVLRYNGGIEEARKKSQNEKGEEVVDEKEMVEITPANLITAIITENGVMTPAAVSEEVIKLWF